MKNSFVLPHGAGACLSLLLLITIMPFGRLAAQQGSTTVQQISTNARAGSTVPRKGSTVTFKKQVLTADFISGGVTVADVNKDGLKDILAGAFYFLAPEWTPHELAPSQSFKVKGGYSNSFLNFSLDVDQDGWTDFIRIDEPGKAAYWYKNPRNEPGHWERHLVYEAVGNETPITADVDGDGRMDLVFNDPVRQEVLWLSPPRQPGETRWKKYVISSDKELATHKYTHGLGYGDINGDGIGDIAVKDGWWEGPADPRQANWKFHKARLGDECAHMIIYDFNGDGLNDILNSSAHKYGIWWQEQVRNADGEINWKEHEIYTQVSQTHGLALADINGDGAPDFVTGKRYFGHNGNDPGALEPAMLYWFEFKPGAVPAWIPHEIDNDSGIGLHVVVEDMNADGLPDIVVANKKGVHYFEQID